MVRSSFRSRILPAGKKPWLLVGEVGAMMIPTIQAYLPPTTESAELRRGQIIEPFGLTVLL